MLFTTYYPGCHQMGLKKFRSTGASPSNIIFDDPDHSPAIHPAATDYMVGVFNWTTVVESTGAIATYSVPRVDCLKWDGSGNIPIFEDADLQSVDLASVRRWSFDIKTYGYVTADKQYGQVMKCTTSLTDISGVEHAVKEWTLGSYPSGVSYSEELIMVNHVTGPTVVDPGRPGGAKLIVLQCAWSSLNAGRLMKVHISAGKAISTEMYYSWPTKNGEWLLPSIPSEIGFGTTQAVQSQDPLAMARLAITEASDADKNQYINI